MYYFNNLLTCWALSMLLIAALAWRSWETCCLTWARYCETSVLPSANLFWANSVTFPAIMLFLSLKRQSDPPKKQSRETTFWRNPSLELACSSTFWFDWDLMASSMVEWIWALISLVEREATLESRPVASPDSARADWTSPAISWIWA